MTIITQNRPSQMIEQKGRDPKKAKYFLVSILLQDLFILFSLKSYEIKIYQILFYKENLRGLDIRAFDSNAEPKLLKEVLF